MTAPVRDIRPRKRHAVASDDTVRDLERALVSGLAFDPSRIPDVLQNFDPGTLVDAGHAAMLRAEIALHDAGLPIDAALLENQLDKAGQLDTVGGLIGLAEILAFEGTGAYVEHYARELKRNALGRRARFAHERLAVDLDDTAAKIDLDSIEAELAEPEALRVLTASEFESDVAPASIIEGLVYEASTHSQNGASKAGKTYAAAQLAMCAATGTRFLGLATRRVTVLYLSFELSAGMLRERMRAIARDARIPEPVIGSDLFVIAPTASAVPHLDLTSDGGAAALEGVIATTGARLVILDTLYRFLPGADPNDNGEMGRVFGRLNDLAQRSGAALFLLDHMSKGEQLGPVSHSATGANVKGGAVRVAIALKRTSREDGGRWSLDVESHFGSWEEPLYYERPKIEDGTRGSGCISCTATEAHGLPEVALERVFLDFGERIDGDVLFPSKRKLRDALIASKLAGGNAQGDAMIGAILRDYCAPESAKARCLDRPVLTRPGPREATVFIWRMGEPSIDTTWRSDAVL